MSDERPKLRVVGDDERVDDDTGSLPVVISDLEVAHGHVIEATAEFGHCRVVPEDALLVAIILGRARSEIESALRVVRGLAGP